MLAAKWVLYRPAKLLKVWRRLSQIVATIAVLFTVSAAYSYVSSRLIGDPALNTSTLERFSKVNNVNDFFSLNYVTFAWQQLDSIIYLIPLVLWCCTAGMLARRFDLLTQNKRAKVFWQQHISPTFCRVALLLNLGLALCSIVIHQTDSYENRIWVIGTFSGFLGIALSASFVATLMRYLNSQKHLPAWMIWLAPAGRHTLAMYLSLSTLLVLSNGAFFNVHAGTVTTLLTLTIIWLVAIVIARSATKRNLRDPIARWLSITRS
jgi:uncharacterized protein